MLLVEGAIELCEPDIDRLALLHRLLVDDAERFWARQRWDIAFRFNRDGRWSHLVLLYRPSRGYHVRFRDLGNDPERVLVRTMGDASRVTIHFCGEPEVVSGRTFVAETDAWMLIEQFRTDGACPVPPPGTRWMRSLSPTDAIPPELPSPDTQPAHAPPPADGAER